MTDQPKLSEPLHLRDFHDTAGAFAEYIAEDGYFRANCGLAVQDPTCTYWHGSIECGAPAAVVCVSLSYGPLARCADHMFGPSLPIGDVAALLTASEGSDG